MSNAKQKLDEVNHLHGDAVLDGEFVSEHKELLKSITVLMVFIIQWDFEILGNVLEKLQKDNMHEYVGQRDLLIKTIRQQIKRFRELIPGEIK